MRTAPILFQIVPNTLFCQTHVTYSWVQHFGNPDHAYHCTGISDGSGNNYFVGNTQKENNDIDILVAKLNNKGTILWQQEYGNSKGGIDYGIDITIRLRKKAKTRSKEQSISNS